MERIITLATQYDRYSYRRITAMLRQEWWQVNHNRTLSLKEAKVRIASKVTVTEDLLVAS